jgi:SAM-dependent methyltransferase
MKRLRKPQSSDRGYKSELADWPGGERRDPARTTSSYLTLREITRSLIAARDRYLEDGARVLDVGCGVQPYYPIFAEAASVYDGNDVEPGPRIKYVSPVESLDVPDASYDLVLCTQVLEHVRYPQKALSEIARVLAPSGHVFLTAPAVYPFHPHPTDYWRWTQQGFDALIEDIPGLELVELVPHGGSGSAVAIIVNTSIREAGRATHLSWLGAPLIAAINGVGAAIDAVLPPRAKAALIPNFLAVARRS